jgi:hypothetical protein
MSSEAKSVVTLIFAQQYKGKITFIKRMVNQSRLHPEKWTLGK